MSVVDDQTKPEIAVTAIDKLLHETKVDIVAGIVWSNVQIAIYDPIVKSQTILLNTNAGSNVPAGKDCSPYFISTSWQSDQFTEATAELLRADKVKNVFVVAPNYQIGKDVVSLFKEDFKGDVVGEIVPAGPDRFSGGAFGNPRRTAGDRGRLCSGRHEHRHDEAMAGAGIVETDPPLHHQYD